MHVIVSYWFGNGTYVIIHNSIPFPQDSVPQLTVSPESLYLEEAVCFFTQKTHEEVALGVGIHYTKDLR